MKPLSHYDYRDRFDILDLIALFNFKSQSSISFNLATEAESLLPKGHVPIPVDRGFVFNIIGSVDIHHPCDDHIKARFRFVLPERYQTSDKMFEFVRLLLAHLQIPADETYEAHFVSPEKQRSIVRFVDRHGMTDRLA